MSTWDKSKSNLWHLSHLPIKHHSVDFFCGCWEWWSSIQIRHLMRSEQPWKQWQLLLIRSQGNEIWKIKSHNCTPKKVFAIIPAHLISRISPLCLAHIFMAQLSHLLTSLHRCFPNLGKHEFCVQFATQITKLDAQAAPTASQELFVMVISYCTSYF